MTAVVRLLASEEKAHDFLIFKSCYLIQVLVAKCTSLLAKVSLMQF